MDIIAGLVSDNAEIRKRIRNLTNANGVLVSVATDEEKDSVYKNYYDYKEPVKKIAGHRVLALNRGEAEKVLTDRKSTRLNSSHIPLSRMPSSA